MSKLGSGATTTVDEPSSETCVLQASRGRPLMNMPHEPQMPMRQEDRQASVGSTSSLITQSPSSTVRPAVCGMVYSCQRGSEPSVRLEPEDPVDD